MRPVRIRSDGAAILYDADAIDKIDSTFFDPATWRGRGALIGEARGRGAASIVRHAGRELVLRHYRRGGVLGPWLGRQIRYRERPRTFIALVLLYWLLGAAAVVVAVVGPAFSG